MTRVLVVGAIVASLNAVAAAQGTPGDISITTFNPEDATAPISAVEGRGVKIGEGTVLHPIFGAETGVVSNVFYEDTDPHAAGVLRLLAQVGTASLSKERLTAAAADDPNDQNEGSFQYRADLRASYDIMLSGNDTVSSTGGLGVGALFKGMTTPQGRWSFGFDENFTRLIRAANFETDANTNRDINYLRLALHYHPQTSSVSAYLYYANMIDIFEKSTQNFADRMANQFGLHPAWKWLPQTTVYADVSWALYSGIGSNSSMKVSSYPLKAELGIATLLTIATTFNVHAGYTNGFYSAGPSYSAPVVGAALGYRYSPMGRLALTYDYEHQDSINANFYRDHTIRLWWQQLVVPFVLMVQPEVHFREYDGISLVNGQPTRDDVIFSVIGGLHYNFRNSFAATLNYRYTQVATDYRYMVGAVTDDPSYARHELLLGVRWAL